MTTIAYRNGVLAADTSAGIGGSVVGRVTKIARNAVGDLAGAAGNACYAAAFLDWFIGGEKGEPPKAENDPQANSLDRGVIFRRADQTNGEIVVYEDRGNYHIIAPYFAMGCGRPEALGAMFAGADAETAVRAAIAHDDHTNGEVEILRHSG